MACLVQHKFQGNAINSSNDSAHDKEI